MKEGLKIDQLVQTVHARESMSADLLVKSEDEMRVVPTPDGEQNDIMPVVLKSGENTLDRYQINENAHNQISAKLGIPIKYYDRLRRDYPDLLSENVNRFFEKEPATRLLRTTDGRIRAFVSDRYKAMDNAPLLYTSKISCLVNELFCIFISCEIFSITDLF